MESYTIPEAADAMGRSEANFRRWIDQGLIPAPYLKESVRQHLCYCRGELDILLRILIEHEREYRYFGAQHEQVSHRMFQNIMGFRDITFGRGLTGRV